MKKAIALLVALVMLVALAAGCAPNTTTAPTTAAPTENTTAPTTTELQPQKELGRFKIGVMGYSETGINVDNWNAFTKAIGDKLNVEFVYVVGSTFDEAINVTKVQELISSGCDGIISWMDSATPAIAAECEKAGVLFGAVKTALDTSFETVKSNPNFVGCVNDGTMDKTVLANSMWEQIKAAGVTEVGITIFPAFAYPLQGEIAGEIVRLADEYNKTAAQKINVYEPTVLMFEMLPETYFADHPDVELICGLSSGFVYPTMVAANRTDVILLSTGYMPEYEEPMRDGVIGMQTFSMTEVNMYTIALMVDRLNGFKYPDMPAVLTRIDVTPVIVTGGDDLDVIFEKTFINDSDASKLYPSLDELLKLTQCYNPDATYAALVDAVQHMSLDDIKAK